LIKAKIIKPTNNKEKTIKAILAIKSQLSN